MPAQRVRRTIGDWSLSYLGYDPADQRLRESLCTLANGYFGTRGAAEEWGADEHRYPGTYFSGAYNRLQSEVAGRRVQNEALVNWPNWLPLSFRAAGGDWLNPAQQELLDYRQTLDLARAELLRDFTVRDSAGRTTRLSSRRLVHQERRNLGALRWTLVPEWAGTLEIRSGLDGTVGNAGVERYRPFADRHLQGLGSEVLGDDLICVEVEARDSRLRMVQVACTRVWVNGERCQPSRQTRCEDDHITQHLSLQVQSGDWVEVEKTVVIRTSGDRAIYDPRAAACTAAEHPPRYAALHATHARAWRGIWRRADLKIDCEDGEIQGLIRLLAFHVMQVANPNVIDEDIGMPARGLHGEAYLGHVFWDELFISTFPQLRIPEITRGHMIYRYHRLGAARQRARDHGARGALFPWRSASDGSEVTPKLQFNPLSERWMEDHTHLQYHVNAAIAYNVWRYYQSSGDLEFLSFYGAEIVLDAAAGLADLACWDDDRKRWVIRGVVGPDEFHTRYPGADKPGLNNNAYTNVMTAWLLGCVEEVLETLSDERRSELCEKLHLGDDVLQCWQEMRKRIAVPILDNGLIAQFDGWGDLEELDWTRYHGKYDNPRRLDRILEAEGDDINRYQVAKQPDVLMLFYLFDLDDLSELLGDLGYELTEERVQQTIDYYQARTSAASTLSFVVQSWIEIRRNREGSWQRFRETLHIDPDNALRGTEYGIHLGAMGGTLDLIQRCYVGIEASGDVLWFRPRMPKEIHSLEFPVRYRHQWLDLRVAGDTIDIHCRGSTLTNGDPVCVGFEDEVVQLVPGDRRRFTRGEHEKGQQ